MLQLIHRCLSVRIMMISPLYLTHDPFTVIQQSFTTNSTYWRISGFQTDRELQVRLGSFRLSYPQTWISLRLCYQPCSPLFTQITEPPKILPKTSKVYTTIIRLIQNGDEHFGKWWTSLCPGAVVTTLR